MDGGGFLVGLGSSVIGRIGSFVASSVESVWLSSIIACTECLWLEGRLVLVRRLISDRRRLILVIVYIYVSDLRT